MLEIVAAHDVRLGMFVAELDRPWLGTPFLMQGFLISNQRQLDALREYCQFVSVDKTKSVFTDFGSPKAPAEGEQPRQPGGVPVAAQAAADPSRDVGEAPPPSVNASGGGRTQMPPAQKAVPTRAPTPPRADRAQPVVDNQRVVAGAARTPHAEPASESFADLERVISVPPTSALGGARHTTYIDSATVKEEMAVGETAFGRVQDLMLDVSLELSKDRLPDPERIGEAVDGMVQSIVRNPDAMILLSRLKRSDNYSYDHALDVSIHMIAFGRHLGFPLDQLSILGMAGLLQDIGKTRVPEGLLQQTAPLSPAERWVLRRHVDFGVQILNGKPGIPPKVIEVASRHHERYDGSGYPSRLAGEAIGLFGEMAGVVDAYCAMSFDRPYRAALDNQRVLRKLYSARGKAFAEPLIVEFIQCVGLYPIGTLVELYSGEVAVVVEQNRILRLKPRVLVILDANKSMLAAPRFLDLKSAPDGQSGASQQIRRALQPGSHGIDPREYYL